MVCFRPLLNSFVSLKDSFVSSFHFARISLVLLSLLALVVSFSVFSFVFSHYPVLCLFACCVLHLCSIMCLLHLHSCSQLIFHCQSSIDPRHFSRSKRAKRRKKKSRRRKHLFSCECEPCMRNKFYRCTSAFEYQGLSFAQFCTVDLICFVSRLISVIYLLRTTKSNFGRMCAIDLYAAAYGLDQMLLTQAFLALLQAFDEDASSGSEANFHHQGLNAADTRKFIKRVLSSKLVSALRRFVATLIGLFLCKENSSLNMGMFKVDLQKFASDSASPITLLDSVLETVDVVLGSIKAFADGSTIADLFRRDDEFDDIENNIARLEGDIVYVEIGNFKDSTFQDNAEFGKTLRDTIDRVKAVASRERGSARVAYSNYLSRLMKLRTRFCCISRERSLRTAPFAILISGDSSIGKSSLTTQFMKLLLHCNGFCSSSEYITTLNLSDKYQSDYREKHNGVILDDLMNTKLNFVSGDPPSTFLIKLLNNIPMSTVQADVELKGMIMMEPKVVIGTTNVPNLLAPLMSNEPISVLRRFPYHISAEVLPEYRRPGTTMLSENLNFDGPASFWKLTVDRYEGLGNKDYRRRNIMEGSFEEVAHFLVERSKEHFARQEKLVQTSSAMYEAPLCEHDFFPNLCAQCKGVSEEKADEEEVAAPVSDDSLSDSVSDNGSECPSDASTVVPDEIMEDWSFGNFRYQGAFDEFMGVKYFLPRMLACFFNVPIVSTFESYFNASSYRIKFVVSFFLSTIYLVSPGGAVTVAGWLVAGKLIRFRIRHSFELAREMFRARTNKMRGAVLLGLFGVSLYTAYVTFRELRSRKEEVVTAFQAISGGVDLPEEENYTPSPWKRTVYQPVPASEPATTTSMLALQDMCASQVRRFSTTSGFKSCMFPICRNMWVMNKHAWPDHERTLHITCVRGDVECKANAFEATLNRERTFSPVGSDLIFFDFPAAGSVKDFRPYLLDEANLAFVQNKAGCLLVRREDGSVSRHDLRNITHNAASVNGQVFPKSATYRAEGLAKGHCGGPIVVSTNSKFIFGIHFAGNNLNAGAGAFISKEMVEQAVSTITRSSVAAFQLHSAGTLKLETGGVSFGPMTESHQKSAINNVIDANVDHYGKHAQGRRTQRSNVRTQMISESVTRVCGVENKWGKPQRMNDPKHFRRHLEKIGSIHNCVDEKILDMAVEDYYESMIEALEDMPDENFVAIRPLSPEDVCSGVDGRKFIEPLNMSTSAGWPFNTPKRSFFVDSDKTRKDGTFRTTYGPELEAMMEEMTDTYLKGERCHFIFRANLKDTPTKVSSDKVRVFAGAPVAASCLIRKYLLGVVAFMQQHPKLFECAVGVNAHGPQWTDLMSYVRQFGNDRGIGGDYGSYDARMSIVFTRRAYGLLYELICYVRARIKKNTGEEVFTEDDLCVIRGLLTDLCQPVYEHDGDIIGVIGSNPSGHNLTVNVNSIVNSLYFRYAYFSISDFQAIIPPRFKFVVALLTYGDDNLCGVRTGYEWFNHTAVQKVLESIGVVYTMADKCSESVPFISFEDTTFLKRKAVWDENLKEYLAPIEKDSIFKTLHCTSSNISKEELAGLAIDSALNESFYHGKEFYDKMVHELCSIADEHRLRAHVTGGFPTYEQQLGNYITKYKNKDVGSASPCT